MKKDNIFWIVCLLFYAVTGAIGCYSLYTPNATFDTPKFINTSLYDINTDLSKAVEETPTPAPTQAPTDAPVQPTEEPVVEEESYTYVSTNVFTVLHVRTEPGLTADIIGFLLPHSTGDVIEKGSEWSLIQHDDITGYVSNEFLEFYIKE